MSPQIINFLRFAETEMDAAPTSVSLPPVQSPRKGKQKLILPPIKKASELMGDGMKTPTEVVKGMLCVGSTMVYGGASKTNKTFALMDLGLSVAAGVGWWGMETTKGKVLYIDFELQVSFFKKRLDAIGDAKKVPSECLEDFHVWTLRGKAGDIDEIKESMLTQIQSEKYKLIIIDPIYKVLGDRDENSAGDINSLMNVLESLAVESGAAIVVGHHFSKGGQAGKNSMDRISGSGVFARSPDAIVIITQHEEENVFSVEMTLRNFKQVEPFCVEWDYPLMKRNDSYDASHLRIAGKRKEKFTTQNLLAQLGAKEMTTTEWQDACCTTYKMKPRTFYDKKKTLVDANEVHESNGKWKVGPKPPTPPVQPVENLNKPDQSTAATANAVCA